MSPVDTKTGEVTPQPELNKVIYVETKRANGSVRIQQDFSNCPTMAEQHTAHLTDLNYLMDKHQPDELAAYLAARESYRQEILGHDFSEEPSLQEANNMVYNIKAAFNALPDKIRNMFSNHVEYLKFLDNPANAEKLVELGVLTKKQVQDTTDGKPVTPTTITAPVSPVSTTPPKT